MAISMFLAIAFLHFMAAISPGPAVLMSVRTGLTEGMRTGTALAAGIGVGGVIWAAAALFGLALVFEIAPALLTGFKVLGAGYLLWMAWKMWRSAGEPFDLTPTGAPPRSLRAAFMLGLTTQLSNPKPAVMFSAIFAGTVPPGTSWLIYLALLGVVFFNEAVWNVLVVRVFSFERTKRGYVGMKSTIDRCFGGLLAVLGIKIVAT
ncbi:LysE family translocator [Pseudoruegeria sp. SK021]|uniref:LysE family translocator n=1 Tax=Pseudoruegeria sp. SK021 TaxID=1933035 RepID=UPI000A263D12|nr:LysE family translocator [Pseudoruegeria sp. SK021]OSP56254.1 transporter [Pseudoruegeria sp. SK021]